MLVSNFAYLWLAPGSNAVTDSIEYVFEQIKDPLTDGGFLFHGLAFRYWVNNSITFLLRLEPSFLAFSEAGSLMSRGILIGVIGVFIRLRYIH